MKQHNIGTIQDHVESSVKNLTFLIDEFKQVSTLLDLLEHKTCPMFVTYADEHGYFKYVNQNFADVLGYTKKELYNIPWTELMSKQEAERVFKELNKILKGGEAFTNYKTTYKTKDGKDIPLTWFTGPVGEMEDQTVAICFAYSH